MGSAMLVSMGGTESFLLGGRFGINGANLQRRQQQKITSRPDTQATYCSRVFHLALFAHAHTTPEKIHRTSVDDWVLPSQMACATTQSQFSVTVFRPAPTHHFALNVLNASHV
jgi:hypothetical protein